MSAEKPATSQPESSPEPEEQAVNTENLEQHDQDETTPETPGQQSPERQSEETYKNIADTYVDSYAGDISDEERTQLQADILERIKNIQVSTKDELVKEYERIIAGLKHYAESRQGAEASDTEAPAQDAADSETDTSPEQAGKLPADADEYDHDQLEAGNQQEKKRNWVMRKLMGANAWLGAGVLRGYSFVAERQAKTAKKYEQQPGESDEDYEKRKHKASIVAWVGAAAIGGLLYGTKAFGLFDHSNGSGDHSSLHDAGPGAGTFREHEQDMSPYEIKLNGYNNSDSSFYDFGHKQFAGDFGPGLKAMPEDGKMGPGFTDWMDRNKHEPNGLANLVSGLKLDGKGDSMADRNQFADFLDHSPQEQMRYDEMVQEALKDDKRFGVETVQLHSYDSTLMTDANGDPVISAKKDLNLGGSAFKITNKETGEVTYWRKDCGGYQQVWPHTEAPAPAAPIYHEQQPAGQGGTPVENPGGQGGEIPSNPEHPETPENPSTPQPETPPTPKPETPKPEIPVTPDDHKDWSKVPDQDGVAQLPLNQDTTPLTDQPTPGANDFQPGKPDSAPGADTGPGVSVPGATPGNNGETGNTPEPGVNGNQPNKEFDDSNL